jgi:hypothetical protein
VHINTCLRVHHLKQVGMDEIVRRYPEGLNMMLSENGENLSVGQVGRFQSGLGPSPTYVSCSCLFSGFVHC